MKEKKSILIDREIHNKFKEYCERECYVLSTLVEKMIVNALHTAKSNTDS